MTRALVCGWFSFEGCGAGVGDLLVRDVVCDWLAAAGVEHDVALAAPFNGGVSWSDADPRSYSHVVFVGGELARQGLLEKFESCALVGLNVSLLEPIESWNPFDVLIERDSTRATHPDLAFVAVAEKAPVTGVILADTRTWPNRQTGCEAANRAIEHLVESTSMCAVRIDTALDRPNLSGLRTPAEIESLIASMDVVLTARLHGMVLALKHGVPVLAVDPLGATGKISRQAATVGWPMAYPIEAASDTQLRAAWTACLEEPARALAMDCCRRATMRLADVKDQFMAAMAGLETGLATQGRTARTFEVRSEPLTRRARLLRGVNRAVKGPRSAGPLRSADVPGEPPRRRG